MRKSLTVIVTIAMVAAATYAVFAALSLSTTVAVTQNFDGMQAIAAASLPADFRVDKPSTVRTVGNFSTAATATSQIGGANLSSSASNGIYNFGAGTGTTGTDRAVGFLSSGTATQSGNLYAQFANGTGAALTGLNIAYDIEKYRTGSNPAGFCMQLYYSTDGAAWTTAGAPFLTTFVADAGPNAGYPSAPGATVTVNGTLPVAIPDSTSFFLAWNYSVCSGTTTTNGQALAIDNISVLGLSNAPTNPTGMAAASPNPVQASTSTLLTVTVTPGANPASTGLTVQADLTAIGGSSTQAFFDDGTHGDATAGDNIFSFQATVPFTTSAGQTSITALISDAQSRSSSTAPLTLTVTPAMTSPTGTGAASPNALRVGDTTLLSVTVVPGANPTSTGLSVTANLSAIGVPGVLRRWIARRRERGRQRLLVPDRDRLHAAGTGLDARHRLRRAGAIEHRVDRAHRTAAPSADDDQDQPGVWRRR